MQSVLIQNINSAELEDLISKAVASALKGLNTDVSAISTIPAASDELLNKKEAAKYLKISLPTLSKYINEGYVKAYTVSGTRMRFKTSDLDKALKVLRHR